MANLSLNDTDVLDMSEFEKLANSLEFENKQYVKMIERENHLISSHQQQIHECKGEINRAETDISRLDEETMRLHKQFVHAKDTLKNLKNTYNVMTDHEVALSKQLEALKIKSSNERQFYQEQMMNYSNIRDNYMMKYASFPLAQELNRMKEILSTLEKESTENQIVVANLQQKILEKEAMLDFKIRSRMIVKIAQVKLSTLQIEKEVHECLVKKTSLLEQLKEIQGTPEHPEPIDPIMDNNGIEIEEDASMTDDDRNERNAQLCKPRARMDNDCLDVNSPVDKSDGLNLNSGKTENDCVNSALMNANGLYMESGCTPESDQSHNSDNDGATIIPDSRPISVNDINDTSAEQTAQTPKDAQSVPSGKEASSVTRQTYTSSLSRIMSRLQTFSKPGASQIPVPKVSALKPSDPCKLLQKEVLKPSQKAVLSVPKLNVVPRLASFTHKITLPSFHVQKVLPNGDRYTDTNALLKESPMSQKPFETHGAKMQYSTASMTNFSVPKVPELSFTNGGVDSSTFQTKSVGQLNFSKKIPSEINGYQVPTLSLPTSSISKQMDKKIDSKRELPDKLFSLNQNNILPSESTVVVDNQLTRQTDSERSAFNFGFGLTNEDDIESNEPLFKTSSIIDTSEQEKITGTNTITLANVPDESKSTFSEKKGKRFGFGSVFKESQDDSRSPDAFNLIHFGNENNADDTQTTFLPFESSSGNVDERPSSLLDFFSSEDKQSDSKTNSQINFNFSADETNEGWKSSFNLNFGKSDDDDNTGGGFLNFENGFNNNKESESDGKELVFKLF